MPWKTISIIGERLRFVKEALKAQKPFTQLCRLFGISRPAGYKWIDRFIQGGRRALQDQSRRPITSPARMGRIWIERLRRLRRRQSSWGARKIAGYWRRIYPRGRRPCSRTLSRYLVEIGAVRHRRRRSPRGPQVMRAPLTAAIRPNQVWTVDFKGWFRTRDGQRVEPLTVRDLFSRFVLVVRLLADQSGWRVKAVLMGLFIRYGVPEIIRVDNGGPFGSSGPAGLSRLSAWWSALGIRVEFIRPGHPEDNGAHEQFHRVLKAETTRPPSSNPRAQQRRLGRWVQEYNYVRPHEGLSQQIPAGFYRRSRRAYQVPEGKLRYAKRWEVRRVRSNGQIRWHGRKRFIGEAFVGRPVGLKRVSIDQSEVYFGSVLLGVLRESDAGGLRPSAYIRQRPTNPQQKV